MVTRISDLVLQELLEFKELVLQECGRNRPEGAIGTQADGGAKRNPCGRSIIYSFTRFPEKPKN